MSAFKRRVTSKHPPLPQGTRPSPGSPATTITSTGIPSLDDILGGGLPLSCSLLVLAPDAHSAYGELVLKYFAAQGLASGQRLCIVDPQPETFLSECMWIPGAGDVLTAPTPAPVPPGSTVVEDEEDERASEHDTKIKIAWRYEQMKQFQTTVPSPSQSTDEFCRTFDLTCRVPESFLQAARTEGRLVETSPDGEFSSSTSSSRTVLARIEETLSSAGTGASLATRICVPSLGSYDWGDTSPQDICYFLHSLRALLRRYPRATAAVCLPPYLCSEGYGGSGWTQKLGWLTDASVTLSAFTGNHALTSMFSAHHGLVHIHSLPAPHTLLPPSDKFSTLRGLTSSGENNLAFKCMRKRLIFETLHLDVEGGVSERRTTPTATTILSEPSGGHELHDHTHAAGSSVAAVQVQLEQTQLESKPPPRPSPEQVAPVEKTDSGTKKVKVKKKVAFTSERPDLYDF